MAMNRPPPTNSTLSPVSVDSSEWSPLTRYQSLAGDNPYASSNLPPLNTTSPAGRPPPNTITPPASGYNSGNPDGSMAGSKVRSNSNGNPSPPSSIARSSDGAGLYASSTAGESISSRKAQIYEEALSEHYITLKSYLATYLRDESNNPERTTRARDKLLRLSVVQFQELSTDVYDELLRREDDRAKGLGSDVPRYLLPKSNFHPKRNQARQKLSTLPPERFRQLAADVFFELERRFPRFTSADIERVGSPALSTTSSNRGPVTRSGTPNSMLSGSGVSGGPSYRGLPPGSRGPPSLYRDAVNNPGGALGATTGHTSPGGNEFGRPLPKTFQQNMIIPNKSTMVEDDDDQSMIDDEDDDGMDAFGLEGAAAARMSKRTTNKSFAPSEADKQAIAEAQKQAAALEEKANSLEARLQEREAEIEKLTASETERETAFANERKEWSTVRTDMEKKLAEAQELNASLKMEISKIQVDHTNTERDLRNQLAEAQVNAQRASDTDTASRNSNGEEAEEWRRRYESLSGELAEQQKVTDSVRREASEHLREMRMLSQQTGQAFEKEELLKHQVAQLERDVKEWKSRYARTKTQLRSIKASSIGLLPGQSLEAGLIAAARENGGWMDEKGLVKDVHVTKFQLAVDELLQVARSGEPDKVLNSMKTVVVCVRHITGDVDLSVGSPVNGKSSSTSSPSPTQNGLTPDPPLAKVLARLKSKVSATANNLITASKNFANAQGLSPVSLLDAAASHLSTAVVELIKAVKVRRTPPDELQDDDTDVGEEVIDVHNLDGGTLVSTNGNSLHSLTVNGNNKSVRASASWLSINGTGHRRGLESKGSTSSYRSNSNDSLRRPDTWTSRQSSEKLTASAYGGFGYGAGAREADLLEELKIYLEDSTATLVHSIQPMIQMIRSAEKAGTANDHETEIGAYVNDIASTVADICLHTTETVTESGNLALEKHALPVVKSLEGFREALMSAGTDEKNRDKISPLAFKIARATKELVLRVDRIESGELTAEMDSPVEV